MLLSANANTIPLPRPQSSFRRSHLAHQAIDWLEYIPISLGYHCLNRQCNRLNSRTRLLNLYGFASKMVRLRWLCLSEKSSVPEDQTTVMLVLLQSILWLECHFQLLAALG